jgi:hypothetical protein
MPGAAKHYPRSAREERVAPTLNCKYSTQEIVMTHKCFVPAAAALLMVAALLSTSAMASGSDAGGGAETGNAQAYNTGKGIYAQKLACKSCPLAGRKLDAALASQLLTNKETYSLSTNEQQALATYLKLRFRL